MIPDLPRRIDLARPGASFFLPFGGSLADLRWQGPGDAPSEAELLAIELPPERRWEEFAEAARSSDLFLKVYAAAKTSLAVATARGGLVDVLLQSRQVKALDFYQADLIAELSAAGQPLSDAEIEAFDQLRDDYGIR